MKRPLLKLVLAISFPALVQVHAAAAWGDGSRSPLEEAAIYLRSNFGIAVKQVLLDISDTDTLDTVAMLEGDLVLWPFLSFQSPAKYFGESRFGWLMEYGLSGFSIDKQSEPFSSFDAVDRGTSAKGWFVYAMPTITWDPSERFRLGLGVGGGILSLKGDALVYDPAPTVNRIGYDFTELTWGGYFLAEYVAGSFMVGTHAGILIAEKNPYDYTVSDTSIILAYHRKI